MISTERRKRAALLSVSSVDWFATVKPGDMLILQEMPGDATGRYIYQTLMNFNLLWTPLRSSNVTGVLDVSAPDRLPGRLGQVNIVP